MSRSKQGTDRERLDQQNADVRQPDPTADAAGTPQGTSRTDYPNYPTGRESYRDFPRRRNIPISGGQGEYQRQQGTGQGGYQTSGRQDYGWRGETGSRRDIRSSAGRGDYQTGGRSYSDREQVDFDRAYNRGVRSRLERSEQYGDRAYEGIRRTDQDRYSGGEYGRGYSDYGGYGRGADVRRERGLERGYGRDTGYSAGRDYRDYDEERYDRESGRYDDYGTAYRSTYMGYGPVPFTAPYYDQEEERYGREGRFDREGRRERRALRCGDIMTRDVTTCSPSMPLRDAAEILKGEDVGSLPVVDNGRLIGIVTDRDIVCRVLAEGRDSRTATVADAMSQDVVTVTREESVTDAIQKMGENQIRRLPVVDMNGRLRGIIAMADIALEAERDRELADALEQISQPTPYAARRR